MDKMNWPQKQRLKFIENRLYWQGYTNRKDVQDYFGVSSPVVSNDFGEYLKLNPDAMTYDGSAKMYVAAENFKPVFFSPDAENYLMQIVTGEHLLDFTPPVVYHDEQTKIDPQILRTMVMAIKNGSAVEVNTADGWQWITPEAFVYESGRWQLKAYRHINRTWENIKFPEILTTGNTRPHNPPKE